RFAGPPGTFEPISISTIFQPLIWEHRFQNGAFFKDKIVLIGPEGNWGKDEIATPFNQLMPGPELHLNAANAAIQGEYVMKSSRPMEWGFLCAAGVFALILTLSIARPVARLLAFVAVT